MRKKLLLALSGAMLSFYSFADLGNIRVNSYLNQNLNAVVPITGIPDSQYSGLSIGLASSARFRNNGINFNPELGSLLFKVINNGSNHYLVITSSKPIKSPVLNLLLHYSLGDDDFYRQFTVLLDPLDETTNTTPQKTTTSTVKNSGPSYANPIPVKMAKLGSKPAVKNDTPSYNISLNDPFVKARLGNFDQSNMSYITSKGDTLYTVARFEQSIYPQAKLGITQLIIGLGFENYLELKPVSQEYESGFEILLTNPRSSAQIDSDDADQYLLATDKSQDFRKQLLQKMASKYDASLVIESSDLFIAKPVVASAPIKHQFKPVPPIQYSPDPTLIDQILEFKFYILGLLLALGGLLAFRKKIKFSGFSFRRNAKESAETNTNNVASSFDITAGITIDNIMSVNQASMVSPTTFDSVSAVSKTNDELNDQTINFAGSSSSEASQSVQVRPEVVKVSSVDEDLVNTLEQILSFDESRDDIRFKLFELYLSGNLTQKADVVYKQLNTNLDEDNPLRISISDVASHYGYKLATASEAQIKQDLQIEHNLPSNVYERENDEQISYTIPSSNDAPRVIDFSDVPIPPEKIAIEEDIPDYSSARVLDFHTDNPFAIANEGLDVSVEPLIDDSTMDDKIIAPELTTIDIADLNFQVNEENIVPSSETVSNHLDFAFEQPIVPSNDLSGGNRSSDEELNLAQMYYHIDELAKSKEILSEIIQNPDNSSDMKEKAKQMIKDFGLND